MKLGLLVAIEMEPVFACYEALEKLPSPKGFALYHTVRGAADLYILHTGMGEVAAAAGAQYLITALGVEAIVNYGVVGGLSESMMKERVCVVERVVHYKYDCSEFMPLQIGQVAEHDSIFLPTDAALLQKAREIAPALPRVTCCSGDKFVGTEAEKRHLHEAFEGDVCDMESAGIVLTCEANEVPCLLLKSVSDGLAGGAREFYEELQDASAVCLRVADSIMAQLA